MRRQHKQLGIDGDIFDPRPPLAEKQQFLDDKEELTKKPLRITL